MQPPLIFLTFIFKQEIKEEEWLVFYFLNIFVNKSFEYEYLSRSRQYAKKITRMAFYPRHIMRPGTILWADK